MTIRTKIAAGTLVLLGLVGVSLWDLNRTRDERQARANSRRVFSLTLAAVDRLTIVRNSGEETIHITKDAAGVWTVQAPKTGRANQGITGNLLNALLQYQFQKIFKPEAGLPAYGLDAPALKVTIGSGSKEETVLIGTKSATDYSVYLQRTGDPDVMMGSAFLLLALNHSAYELLERR